MGVARRSKQEWMLEREQIANRKKALGASGNGLQFTMHLLPGHGHSAECVPAV